MNAGYWLNPETGKCVRVPTTHDEWVRDWGNAQSLGLSRNAYDEIMTHPSTDIDAIRLVAVHEGLVRIREHPSYTSVQFAAQRDRITSILRAVLVALNDVKLHPDTRLVIDNLLSHDSITISLRKLESALATDVPVLGEQLFDEIRRRANRKDFHDDRRQDITGPEL